jgi:ElaB/YqjD/DUF883 family membrane-anchored ribosome-binding protein
MTNYAGPGPDRDPLATPAEGPLSTSSPTGELPVTEGSTYTSEHARDTAVIGRPTDETAVIGRPAGDTAERAKEAVSSAATDVAQTAKHEARNVAAEMKDQARRVVSDAKQKTSERLDSQQKQWSGQLGDISRDLHAMAAEHPDSPAGQLVQQLADRSSTLADYLASHRAQDLMADLQDFARRRPGTFLAAMAAAGFVVGRLGKSVAMAAGEGDGGDARVR